MNKRGYELAISTMILLILGIFILIALILSFTGAWEKFWTAIKGYSGSDIDNLGKLCQNQCDLANKYSFCCEEKELGKEKINCSDKRLNVECSIDCSGACGK